MKRIILGAVVGLFVASCSNNETVSLNQDEIQFNVVANKMAKAADMYCNNALPAEFYVWANYNNEKTYIAGDRIEKVTNGTTITWENKTDVRYWPEDDKTLDFYAHVNAGDKFIWTSGGTPTITDFTVATNVAQQKDLLYATAMNKGKSTDAVALNFRHALSQIVFQARNTNKHLHVIIDGVSVCNVGGTNTFTYPSANTDGNVDEHNQPVAAIGTQGTWNSLTGGNVDYAVTFDDTIHVEGNNNVVSLTFAPDANKEYNANTMLLLPQTTTAWVPIVGVKPADAANTGTYFLVKCRIHNVAGNEFNETTDVELFNGNAAIPVAAIWEQGKKYIYTFVFGQGNAGYDENGEDVLTPISFTVTVDDFTNATNTDVEMVKK